MRVHQEVAFRTAYLITGDAAEAEDAAQEAFVKEARRAESVPGRGTFRPWLLTIVANEARNRRKAASRRAGLVLRVAEDVPRTGVSSSPESAALAAERRSELLVALSELREEERVVISCRYFLELSKAETAAALGCAKGTVKSRLSRATG